MKVQSQCCFSAALQAKTNPPLMLHFGGSRGKTNKLAVSGHFDGNITVMVIYQNGNISVLPL